MDSLDSTAQLIAQQAAEIEHALANLRRLGRDPVAEFKAAKEQSRVSRSTVQELLLQRIDDVLAGDAR